MFHPTPETRKVGLWIYLFGSVGLLSSLSTSAPNISNIIPIPSSIVREASLPGILFFPTAYSFLMFASNAFSEYSYHRARISREELDAALAPSLPTSRKSGNGPRKTIVDRLLDVIITARTLIKISGFLRNMVEVALPLMYGFVCSLILLAPGLHAMDVIFRSCAVTVRDTM